MKFFAKPTDILKFDGDTLVVGVFVGKKGEIVLSKEALLLDKKGGGLLETILTEEAFEPTLGATSVLYPPGYAFRRVVVLGLGKEEDLTVPKLHTGAAAAGRRARMVGAKRVGFVLPEASFTRLGSEKGAEGIVVGFALGTYTFTKHKSDDEKEQKKHIEDVMVLTSAGRLSGVSAGVTAGGHIAKAVLLARDLVNEPPSVATPTYLADVAKDIAKISSHITTEVFGRTEIAKMGMGGLLGISQGSDEEPKFIKLEYRGGGRKTIVLAGKGITYDTGGLSLKPPKSMETMKLDMAGAAAILGVFSVLPMFAPKVHVVGLIPATENMPGSKALKPGDVVRVMNGKSVEVLNIDAEGRMVLADALSYATSKLAPDVIIDVATLTGACIVALGEDVAGLFANEDVLAGALLASAKETGELLWRMPLTAHYKELLKSPIADLKNVEGGKYGGAITAALFLEEFVGPGIAWAHLDIAGPAFAEKETPTTPRGGTGFGVRMLLEYLRRVG